LSARAAGWAGAAAWVDRPRDTAKRAMGTRTATRGLRRSWEGGTVEQHGLTWGWVWGENLPLPEQAVRFNPPGALGLPHLRELRRMARSWMRRHRRLRRRSRRCMCTPGRGSGEPPDLRQRSLRLSLWGAPPQRPHGAGGAPSRRGGGGPMTLQRIAPDRCSRPRFPSRRRRGPAIALGTVATSASPWPHHPAKWVAP
jgi:hypothetical protein